MHPEESGSQVCIHGTCVKARSCRMQQGREQRVRNRRVPRRATQGYWFNGLFGYVRRHLHVKWGVFPSLLQLHMKQSLKNAGRVGVRSSSGGGVRNRVVLGAQHRTIVVAASSSTQAVPLGSGTFSMGLRSTRI